MDQANEEVTKVPCIKTSLNLAVCVLALRVLCAHVLLPVILFLKQCPLYLNVTGIPAILLV